MSPEEKREQRKIRKAYFLARQIKFVKNVASEYGHSLTDKEARKAYRIVSRRVHSSNSADFYYALKEYFLN